MPINVGKFIVHYSAEQVGEQAQGLWEVHALPYLPGHEAEAKGRTHLMASLAEAEAQAMQTGTASAKILDEGIGPIFSGVPGIR